MGTPWYMEVSKGAKTAMSRKRVTKSTRSYNKTSVQSIKKF